MDPVTRTVSAVTLSGEEEPGVTFMGQRYPLRYMALRPDAAGTGAEPPGGGYDGRTVQETLAVARRPASLANALAWSDRAMAVTLDALDGLNRGEPADAVTRQWGSAVTQGQALPPAAGADTLGQRLGQAVMPLLSSAQDLLRETMEQQRAAEDRAAGQAWAKRYAHLASLAPEALLRSTAQRIGEVVGDAALGRMLLDQARREKVARKLAADPSHDWRADPLLEGVDPLVLEDLEVTQQERQRDQESRQQAERLRARGAFDDQVQQGLGDARAGIATPGLTLEDFVQNLGEGEGLRVWDEWRGAQELAPYYAAVRGKSAAEIAAYRASLSDPRLFDQVAGEDAAERARDPAGYALRWTPGLAKTLEGADAAGRRKQLWLAQAALGIPPEQRSPWTNAEVHSLAAEIVGFAVRETTADSATALIAILEERILSLPPAYAVGAVAQLERLGIAVGPQLSVRAVVKALAEGKLGRAYGLLLGTANAAEERPAAPDAVRGQEAQFLSPPIEMSDGLVWPDGDPRGAVPSPDGGLPNGAQEDAASSADAELEGPENGDSEDGDSEDGGYVFSEEEKEDLIAALSTSEATFEELKHTFMAKYAAEHLSLFGGDGSIGRMAKAGLESAKAVWGEEIGPSYAFLSQFDPSVAWLVDGALSLGDMALRALITPAAGAIGTIGGATQELGGSKQDARQIMAGLWLGLDFYTEGLFSGSLRHAASGGELGKAVPAATAAAIGAALSNVSPKTRAREIFEKAREAGAFDSIKKLSPERQKQFEEMALAQLELGLGTSKALAHSLPGSVSFAPSHRPTKPVLGAHWDNTEQRLAQFPGAKTSGHPEGFFEKPAIQAFLETSAQPSTPEENIRRGLAAIDVTLLSAMRNGGAPSTVVPGAMWRKELGPISFYWGSPGKKDFFNKGSGLSHVIAKHGIEVIEPLIETIAYGSVTFSNMKTGELRAIVEHGDYRVAFAFVKGGERETWVVTGYEVPGDAVFKNKPVDLSKIQKGLFFNLAPR